MKRYTEANFSAHPKLYHILNLFLRDNAVLRHEHKTLLERVAAAEKLADQAKKNADKALSLCKK